MADTKISDRSEPTRLATVVYVGLAITSVLVPLRCYVRSRMMKTFGIDDWFLVLAQIFMLATSIITILSVQHGLGLPLESIPLYYQSDLLRYLLINEVLWAFLTLFIRLTIGLLLLRITTYHYGARVVVIAIMVLSVLNAGHFVVWAMLQCQPISKFWNVMAEGKCHERHFTYVLWVSSAVSVATEWGLAFLPMWLAFRMMIMKTKDRIAVSVVLGLGACAGIVTCVRMVYLGFLLQGVGDIRYICGVIYFWATIENCLAISAACLATFRPILTKILDMTVRSHVSAAEDSRRPSEATNGYTISKRTSAMTAANRRSGAVEYSERILADIDADGSSEYLPVSLPPTPLREYSVEKSLHVVVEHFE